MKHDIAKLKQLLPLDALIAKLGHAPIAKRKAHCPFHEDERDSFSMYPSNGGFRWKCFAGCGEGDEIDFVHKFFDCPTTKAAIQRYSDLVGNPIYDEVRKFQGQVAPAKVVKEPKPIVPAKLEPLTPAAAAKIAKWRGLSAAFVQEMSNKGILGLYQNKPAFSATSGAKVRLPDGSWFYTAGARQSLLALGEPAKDKPLCVVESEWDMLALYESERKPVLCTGGAANWQLAIDYIDGLSGGESMDVIAIPQNDREHQPEKKWPKVNGVPTPTSEIWTQNLRAGLMLHNFSFKLVPKEHKDFNDLYKAKKQ